MSTHKRIGLESGVKTLHMLHTLDTAAGDNATTVRLGFKWADLKPGEELFLCVCEREPETHSVQGKGKVEGVWVGKFREIPAYLLQFEHFKPAREYRGLYDSMRKAYGDAFGEWSFVTVVMYQRTK